MKYVDLNCDLGESFGNYTIGMDEAVIPHISSANVGCGWHGGDPLVMRKTLALAKEAGVAVGAGVGVMGGTGVSAVSAWANAGRSSISSSEIRRRMAFTFVSLVTVCHYIT